MHFFQALWVFTNCRKNILHDKVSWHTAHCFWVDSTLLCSYITTVLWVILKDNMYTLKRTSYNCSYFLCFLHGQHSDWFVLENQKCCHLSWIWFFSARDFIYFIIIIFFNPKWFVVEWDMERPVCNPSWSKVPWYYYKTMISFRSSPHGNGRVHYGTQWTQQHETERVPSAWGHSGWVGIWSLSELCFLAVLSFEYSTHLCTPAQST